MALVGVVAVVESTLDDPTAHQCAANPGNHVEVSLTSDLNVWEVRLRTDRGLRSRGRLVARMHAVTRRTPVGPGGAGGGS